MIESNTAPLTGVKDAGAIVNNAAFVPDTAAETAAFKPTPLITIAFLVGAAVVAVTAKDAVLEVMEAAVETSLGRTIM